MGSYQSASAYQVPQGPVYDHRLVAMYNQLVQRGITQPAVLNAMLSVPRHLFVAEGFSSKAYDVDCALPIGYGQTISQPYTVAPLPGLRIRW